MSGTTEAAAAAAANDTNAANGALTILLNSFSVGFPDLQTTLLFLGNQQNVGTCEYNLVLKAFASHVEVYLVWYEDDRTLKNQIRKLGLQANFPSLFKSTN